MLSNSERRALVASSLKYLRNSSNLTMAELSSLIGIHPVAYGTYERARNDCPIEILVRLSLLYDVSVDSIVQSNYDLKFESVSNCFSDLNSFFISLLTDSAFLSYLNTQYNFNYNSLSILSLSQLRSLYSEYCNYFPFELRA